MLTHPCKCNTVSYCSQDCLINDKTYHKNCSTETLTEEFPFFKLTFKSDNNTMRSEDCVLCGERFCSNCDININDELTLGAMIDLMPGKKKIEIEAFF